MSYITYLLIMSIICSSFVDAETKKSAKPVAARTKKIEKVEAPKVEMQKVSEKKKITISNTIAHKDLGYYKFFMTHYPSEFYVQVNGKRLESKEQMVVDDQKLSIVYTYEWASPLGKVKKSKTLLYDVDPKTDTIDLSFTSWKEDEPRIKAPGCSLVKVTEVEESNTIPKEKMSQIMAQAGQHK